MIVVPALSIIIIIINIIIIKILPPFKQADPPSTKIKTKAEG
jgi:hypothetical protein